MRLKFISQKEDGTHIRDILSSLFYQKNFRLLNKIFFKNHCV